MNNYNVLFINHTYYISGADYSLSLLIESLPDSIGKFMLIRKSSHSKKFFMGKCTIEETRFMPIFMTTPRTAPYSILMLIYQYLKLPVSIYQLLRIKKKYNISIIHLNESDLIGYLLLGRMLGLKIVIHARGSIANERKMVSSFLEIFGKTGNVFLLGIDKESVESYPKVYKTRSDIVYNPVRLSKPEITDILNFRSTYNIRESDIIVAQFAALHKEKGIWEIIELMEKVLADYKNVKFLFIGDDRENYGEGPELKKIVQEKKLTSHFIFTGYLTDISTAYGAVDIALCMFGKYLRGVGRTAFEAALAGKPLLATLPDPENSDTIINNVTALVFHPDDQDGIYSGLVKLINDKEFRIKLGTKSRDYMAERHNPKRIAAQVFEIYNRLLNFN